MAMRIDGRAISEEIKSEIKKEIAALAKKPAVAVIYAGSHPAIEKFIERKKQFGEDVGISVDVLKFSEHISPRELADAVWACAKNDNYSAMIVQLPLPAHIPTQEILDLVPKEKDADVLSRAAYEAFEKNESNIFPPVAEAVKEALERSKVSLEGKTVAVMGQGRLVGMPVAAWLGNQGIKPLIIVKETPDPEALTVQADILITGIGDPHAVKPEMIKEGAVLIDAGTSEAGGKIVGDIDPLCEAKASALTPVPGGIGPITVAALFRNVVRLAR